MTIEQLADYVRLPAARLLGLAQAGELPGELAGEQWRFHREHIDRWLAATTRDFRSLEHVEGSDTAAGCTESKDIDEYTSFMAPWDLEFEQLSGGPFHARVDYAKLPGILVYEANWLRAAHTHGATPEGQVAFGTNLAWRRGQNFWCGQDIGPRRIGCGGPKVEYTHTSPEHSHHAVMLVEREILAGAIGEEAVEQVCRRKHLAFTATDGARLAAAITGVVRTARRHLGLLEDARKVARARGQLLEPLVNCLSFTDADDRRGSDLLREACVHRAIDTVEQSERPFTALELANAVGASQKTLEHGFRALLGVTPAVYLRRHRLNGARHDLAHADPASTTVTNIALDWGFSHPGRFSVGYRALFGESPSETLKKAPCLPHAPSSRTAR